MENLGTPRIVELEILKLGTLKYWGGVGIDSALHKHGPWLGGGNAGGETKPKGNSAARGGPHLKVVIL